MPKCARPGCPNSGTSNCSACLREYYCSHDCQKGDWKAHKLICKIIKKLSLQQQPFQDVVPAIKGTLAVRPQKLHLGLRVLEHLLKYALHQFGDIVPGNDYRARENGEQIYNYKVDVMNLFPIYVDMIELYESDESLSKLGRDDLLLLCYQKQLDLLKPWSFTRADSDNDVKDYALMTLSQIEGNIAQVYVLKSQFDMADDYFKRALNYARLFEEEKEEEKPGLLCDALGAYSDLRSIQGRCDEAVVFAEQAYDVVAIAYNPVHPKVQEAAGTLIRLLSRKGGLSNYYDAERFAEAVLSSLKDPKNGVNQESEEVAQGYYDLGNVIYLQGRDHLKAEALIRESLRIRSLLFDNEHQNVGLCVGILASILRAQGNLGNETKEFMERSLAIDRKHFGPDGVNTAISTARIAAFYHQLAETTPQSPDSKKYILRLSETSCKEALRINMKTRGPNHSGTKKVLSLLSIVSFKLMELNSGFSRI